MRFVQVRRHTHTKKERDRGSNISQEGVDLARAVGATLPPFDLVVVSPAQRTLETALAFGCAPEDAIDYPDIADGTGLDFQTLWDQSEPFAEIARLVDKNEAAARAGAAIADVWAGVGRSIGDGNRALVVSHGGLMELGLVAALPDADHASWGKPFSRCEGFELTFDGERFVDVTFARL